jgi:hypothetical protein
VICPAKFARDRKAPKPTRASNGFVEFSRHGKDTHIPRSSLTVETRTITWHKMLFLLEKSPQNLGNQFEPAQSI